ncbi:antitermination protein [Yokenella regensburgei]|uniref:Antitermination protein n=1 Tax=Yokenella regensburgei TaxID=158877 RepID=A0ABX9S4G3_9ENTR|nr:antitermination protein [Yokenella regensburgei]RKR65559.1 antitermination protein [Yokenella regensburgei]VFS16065.1 Antitermination protein [Yokenella regensburgei]
MNLENTVKYHFPKSTQITDSPRATASDSLTGTDVMAAQGMVQARAQMGFAAFMGKMGVSSNDREKAIELLTAYGLTKCDKVAALRKLESNIKSDIVQILATYAFEDYSRSSASKRTCDFCGGNKFIDAEVMTMKYIGNPHLEERREPVKVLCHKCKGKGEISNACSDCKGRGKAISEEETKRQGVPVIANCKRCGGVGYSRLPSTEAFSAVCELTDAISLDTWKKSVKKFYDELITKFDTEEAWADSQLRAVTK